MKLFSIRKLMLPGAMVVIATSFAQAGGLAEPEPEPRVTERHEPLKRHVRPTKSVEKQACRWVTVAVASTAPQWFGSQGLAVSDCCCGTIVISGTAFVLEGQSSTRQELVCDGEENS